MPRKEALTSSLTRNTVLNFVGQAVPLIVGIMTMPFIIRGLGKEAFGILSLAWAIIGYFSLFDFGLARATTKYVAEYLGKENESQLPSLFWTSFGLHLFFGLCGGILLAIITPLLVQKFLNIPAALLSDSNRIFYLLALAIPLVVITGVMRGTLEGAQRFDLVNAVKIPSGALNFLIPAAVLPLGFNLPKIIVLLILARLATAGAYFILCLRVFPGIRIRVDFQRKLVRPLLTYGGWVTISNVIGPILVYSDRFILGSLLTMSAVAYYTAPYEIVTRLWILPLSLATTIFPAFSSLGKNHSKKDLENIYARSVKALLLILGPAVVMILFFAKDIVLIWLGRDFARESTMVLQILALGVLINSLAYIPFALMQGFNRPDIPAKFHLLELPVYIGLLWLLVREIGIAGAALAWTLRVTLDTALLFGAAWKSFDFSFRIFLKVRKPTT